VDVGDIVGLVFAIFFAILILALCFLVWKLTKVVEETQNLVQGITKETIPLLNEVTTSVVHVNEELVRVDAITSNVQSMTANASSLTALFAATLGSPVIKVAAFSYGVRRAAGRRDHDAMEKRIKGELKAAKKAPKS
jgi:predicted PurR-regulated permease PerM